MKFTIWKPFSLSLSSKARRKRNKERRTEEEKKRKKQCNQLKMEKRTENVCADGKSEAKMEREKRNNSNQLEMIMVGKRHHQKYPFDDLPHVRMYLYLSIYLYMSMVIQRYSATALYRYTQIPP